MNRINEIELKLKDVTQSFGYARNSRGNIDFSWLKGKVSALYHTIEGFEEQDRQQQEHSRRQLAQTLEKIQL